MALKSPKVRITKELKPPEAAGVHVRLLCLTGKNKGTIYYLKGKRIVLGRGERADVQVLDTKSSREHAELILHGEDYVLTDLGSQNGVIVNDLKVTQHSLEDSDKIIIGQTVYKYSRLEVAPPLQLVESEDDEEDDDEEDETLALEDKSGKGSKKKKKGAKANDKKKLLYGVVGLLLLWVMLGDDEPQKPKSPKGPGTEIEESTTAVRPPTGVLPKETEKLVTAHIHRGLREYREKNYFRAIEEFKSALIAAPGHPRASFYQERARQRLNEDIEINFEKAKREYEARKFKASIVTYCEIVRLLREYADDERYKAALKNVKDIRTTLGLENKKNENPCFKG